MRLNIKTQAVAVLHTGGRGERAINGFLDPDLITAYQRHLLYACPELRSVEPDLAYHSSSSSVVDAAWSPVPQSVLQ